MKRREYLYWQRYKAWDSNPIPVLFQILGALNPKNRKNYTKYPPWGYIKHRVKMALK